MSSNRRDLVQKLASGFASAVKPIAAAIVKTGSTGLIAGEVGIPTGDGNIPAYRAMPSSGKKFPVTLVVQEIFGVHEHIKDVCRRLAKLGHMAIAPELYARQGDVSKMPGIQEILSTVVAKVPDAQVMADLDATVAWAESTGKGNTGKLGITGFCWGGRIVWLYAAHSPKLKAGVAWYGRLVGVGTDLKAPVLGLYGGKDQGIPVASVEQMRDALKAARQPSELVVYPEAGHGFHADYRPSYNEAAAKDGWQRLQNWFKEHGAS